MLGGRLRRFKILTAVAALTVIASGAVPTSAAVPPRTRVNGKILFTRQVDENRKPVLWIMNSDGSGETPFLTPYERRICEEKPGRCDELWARVFEAIFSPQGDLVAYTTGGFFPRRLRIAAPDGGQDRLVRRPNGSPAEVGWDLAWSPDGEEIAFVTPGDNIKAVHVHTGITRRVHDFDWDDNDRSAGGLDWSPNGAEIAVGADGINGSEGFRIVQASGSGKPTAFFYAGSNPEWSPLGGLVASDEWFKLSADHAVVTNTETGTSHYLLSQGPYDASNCPTWDPDGSRLALRYDGSLYLTTPGESEVVDLDVPTGYCPHWSPDGERLLFGYEDLWSVAQDGSDLRQLADDGAVFLHWQGLPPGQRERVSDELLKGEYVITDEDDSVTVRDPVESFLQVWSDGQATIRERPLQRTSSLPGHSYFGQDVDLWAPDGFRAAFLINRALLPAGEDEQSIVLFFDGEVVPACTPEPPQPKPCVRDRHRFEGQAVLAVRGGRTGGYNFGWQSED